MDVLSDVITLMRTGRPLTARERTRLEPTVRHLAAEGRDAEDPARGAAT